jgi:hypothetical protein
VPGATTEVGSVREAIDRGEIEDMKEYFAQLDAHVMASILKLFLRVSANRRTYSIYYF